MIVKHHKKYKIINKFRFFLFLVSVLIVTYVIYYSFLIANAEGITEYRVQPVYIQEGDTLWAICKEYLKDDMDIRQYIDEVIRYNNLKSAMIKPGQIIFLPIYNN